MNREDLEALLSLGHEVRGVEFKAPGEFSDKSSANKDYVGRVLKAILGMANTRNGGIIVIGVSNSLEPLGLTAEQSATWNQDHLSDAVRNHAEPPINFSVETSKIDGKNFVTIRIEEFAETPIICKKEYKSSSEKPALRNGAIYVRSLSKAETTEVPTYADMQELINLAVDKGVRAFVTRAQRSGLGVLGMDAQISNAERFMRELGELS